MIKKFHPADFWKQEYFFWPYPFYKMFAYKHTETIESVKKYYHFRVLLLHELEKEIFKSAFVYLQKELF